MMRAEAPCMIKGRNTNIFTNVKTITKPVNPKHHCQQSTYL